MTANAFITFLDFHPRRASERCTRNAVDRGPSFAFVWSSSSVSLPRPVCAGEGSHSGSLRSSLLTNPEYAGPHGSHV